MPQSAVRDDVIDVWYDKATVRHTPRILVPSHSNDELIYPPARCIVYDHPLVAASSRETRDYLLTQMAYQFLYGIGLMETKFVIQCSLDVLHVPLQGIGEAERLQALTVIVDEGYHAHVALDYIQQMKLQSGIEPLQVPHTNRKLDTIARAMRGLPDALRMDFQLLAVTLAENVLTDEVASIGRERELTPSFTTLMMDHVRDEGRHSNYFVDLMKARWPLLPRSTQALFGSMLPDYLDDYLAVDSGRGFEREVLSACGFSSDAVTQIIGDSDAEFAASQQSAAERAKGRLRRVLQQIGVPHLPSSKPRLFDNPQGAAPCQ